MRAYLRIGKILKPQGVKGEVKVAPETDDPSRYLELSHICLGENGEDPRKVLAARVHEGYAYLTLENVRDRDEAERLREKPLYIPREEAPPLPEGRYYIVDLIGMRVKTDAGEDLGTLKQVDQAGGNDVYLIRGKRELLVPALKKLLVNVDPEQNEMTLAADVLPQVAVYTDED